jgi:hypothetical protein
MQAVELCLPSCAPEPTVRIRCPHMRQRRPNGPLLAPLCCFQDAKAAVASGGPGGAGPTRVPTLRARLRSLQEAAAALAVPNAFGATLQRAGGAGLNATTSHDQTRYFVSLPSNKLELWMSLEAERFRCGGLGRGTLTPWRCANRFYASRAAGNESKATPN